ncbi:MAG: methyltransferase domain-containing protein [Dehalococcoidia bacterium]|nr:methyltransferase domain-containing protein [Dehalococcoidia bacterium]
MNQQRTHGSLSENRFLLCLYTLSIASMRQWIVRRRAIGKARTLTRRLSSQSKPVQLELGSTTPREGWITIDFARGADLILDLSKRLPFPDGLVDRLYSSHALDHLCYEDAVGLLKESYRILKDGGTLDLCVPDAAFYLKAYCGGQPFDVKRFCVYEFALHYHSRIDLVNYIAFMGGMHKYMYDRENLVALLRSIGFQEVTLRSFDSVLDLQQPDDHECIYALAVK